MKNLIKQFFLSFIIAIPTMAWSASLSVSGKIVDTNTEPIIGAAIIIPGTNQGTTSDQDGKFEHTFNIDDPQNTKIEISYLGYETQTVEATTGLIITMVEASQSIDDVVITACGPKPAQGRKKQENAPNKGCYPTECYAEFKLTGNGTDATCIARDCSENNGSGKYEYDTTNKKFYCKLDKCRRAGYAPNSDGTACTPQRVLSESDSAAQIDELKDNAQKMKDKEQSTANTLLGAAGIGATGIGGMQLASAMAEENADADAEESMRAYLATFHCNYGAGKNIQGGERDIELPGGNELIDLYSEYVNLANDLKVRKAALDMRPGIESEPILDAATSGLYDDVAIGKTSGAYTSLARALMDPNGADAAAWAEQKSDTADKKKTGMITAGIGAVGSLGGNLAINSGQGKQNKVDDILNKYSKKRQLITELESNIAALPPQIVPCPADTTGEKQPYCICNDYKKIFNPKTTACEDCPGDQEAVNNTCECPFNKPLLESNTNKCYAMPQQCTPLCDPDSDPNLQVLLDCSCTCINGFDYKDGTCTCDGENKRVVDGQCQTVITNIVLETQTKVKQILTETTTGATLPTDSLFDLGESTLRNDAKTHISNFINQLSDSEYTNCSIQIDGYTDPLGTTARNQTLSQQRANAVKDYISSLNNRAIKSITATGHGETNCTCGAAQNEEIDYSNYEYKICKDKAPDYQLSGDARYAPCRRVVITPTCDITATTTTTTTNTTTQ